MPRYPQAKENIRVSSKNLPEALRAEIERLNTRLEGRGRVLVRPSGTEPMIRVLAEAENMEEATEACGTISALVRRELG
jgi:phosphoglucosamine mutase